MDYGRGGRIILQRDQPLDPQNPIPRCRGQLDQEPPERSQLQRLIMHQRDRNDVAVPVQVVEIRSMVVVMIGLGHKPGLDALALAES